MPKFGSTKGVGTPKLEHIIQNVWLYINPEPIQSLTMDPRGNFVINGSYVNYKNSPLSGYTVMQHDMKVGKLLLRKDSI